MKRRKARLRDNVKPFVPYYKNYRGHKARVAKMLRETKMSYHDIGIRLGVSDHTVTDTNKELQIRPRRPHPSKVRPSFDLYMRNRHLEKT